MIQGYADWMEYQAALLFGNVRDFEQNTLSRIGRRINKYGKMNSADIKAINNIVAVKEDMDAIIKELAIMTDRNIREIYDIYGEAISYMHEQNRPIYDFRGKKFVPFKDNRELQALVRAYAKSTGGKMINLAKTSMLGFTDKSGNFSHLQKAYTDVLDKAVMAVSSGSANFYTAMRDSIVELGGSGLRVHYDTVSRRLDTVVRQHLLWGAKQASNEYNEMIGDELGCDGIEIDWHSNPRPLHEFMQGKQYALGGAKTVNGIYFESAGPALEALQDYGCLHYKMSIICGVSEPRYDADELARLNAQNSKTYEIGDKKMTGYEASQAMRRLETEVRRQKDIRELARASGDTALVKRCNEHIKAVKAKYTEISNITGIPEELKRMSKVRMPKTDNNIVSTDAKLLTNTGSGGIISRKSIEYTSEFRLPNSISASTIQEKIQGYFLNSNHPVGKHKAKVLNSVLGYHYENWVELSDIIFNAVQTSQVSFTEMTKYGIKYKIPITIIGKKKKSMILNTVWQIDNNSNIPRFITTTFDKKSIKEVE